MQQFPYSVGDVTPSWLEQALRSTGGLGSDGTVLAFTAEQIAVGTGFMSDIFRLHLKIEGNGPEALVIKFPPTTAFRSLGESQNMYRREVEFYRDLAGLSPLRSPRAYAAEYEAVSGNAVLLLEDLGHFDQPDHITGLAPDHVETMIDRLAVFHAWGSSVVDSLDPGLFPRPCERFGTERMSVVIATGWPIYLEHRRHDHPDTVDDFVAAMPCLLDDLLKPLDSPSCIAHGDLRVDNLFFDGPDPVVVDYQNCLRATGVWDVAYLLSQGVSPEVQRGKHRLLVERYCNALNASGLELDIDTAWDQYLRAAAFQVVYPLVVFQKWDDHGPRARDLILTLVERWIATVLDTNAMKELG